MKKQFTNLEVNHINAMYDDFMVDLAAITGTTVVEKASQAVRITQQYTSKLKSFMQDYTLEDNELEIHYYKHLKAKFYTHLHFYADLYHIELRKPFGGAAILKDYFDSELYVIKSDFQKNAGFYQYLRTGETHLDRYYFLKSAPDGNSMGISAIGYDQLAAGYWAKEKLAEHLSKKIAELEGSPLSFIQSTAPPKIVWTDSKTALVELIYAFKAKGSFNNGTATIKQISDYIEYVFDIELNNPSRDFQEILRRKAGYTIYIDGLKENYLKYIDSIEERHLK